MNFWFAVILCIGAWYLGRWQLRKEQERERVQIEFTKRLRDRAASREGPYDFSSRASAARTRAARAYWRNT